MIQYAITPGSYQPFLKRDRPASPSCPANPSQTPQATSLLPFPPSTSLLDQVRRLAGQEVDFIQLREKHLPAGELAALARDLLHILEETPSSTGRKPRLLLNTRADVAAATGAHGVHLPATPGSLTPSQVRRLFRSIGLPPPFVSRSCHTLPEIRTALPHAPDLILFSPVFGKFIDNRLIGPAAGLHALEAACAEAHPIPVLALGGITRENTPQCLAAGAAGIAAIRLFLQ